MTDSKPRKNAKKTRGRPFQKGNPGRPQGARNKVTLAVEKLLDGEAETLTRKAIKKAKDGDMQALKMCMERICPPRKDRPVSFDLPAAETAGDVMKAMSAILRAVAAGDLTPEDGKAVAALLESQRRAVETTDIEDRLSRLEERMQ